MPTITDIDRAKDKRAFMSNLIKAALAGKPDALDQVMAFMSLADLEEAVVSIAGVQR